MLVTSQSLWSAPSYFEVRSNVKGINCDTSVATAVLKTAVTTAVLKTAVTSVCGMVNQCMNGEPAFADQAMPDL